MYIHIGNRRIVSDKSIVGIFNVDTLLLSDINKKYTRDIDKDAKTIVIDRNNNIISGNVSSFTIIKRRELEDYFWRKKDDQQI